MFDFLKNLFSTTPLVDDEPTSAQAEDADRLGIIRAVGGSLEPACDQIKGAYGEFGFDLTNPIPVNGVTGSIVYLNRLCITRGPGAYPFFFHRLGSFESPVVKGLVDGYELVSSDASTWLTLYLHYYHPRRSRRAPTGLRLFPWSRMEELRRSSAKIGIFGSNGFVKDFPFGILRVIEGNETLASVSPVFQAAMARHIRKHLLKHRGQWGRPEPDWFSDSLPQQP